MRYSGTSLIWIPKIRAPPSNEQLLNSKLGQIRVGQWAWQVDNDLLVSNQQYSDNTGKSELRKDPKTRSIREVQLYNTSSTFSYGN